MAYTHIQVLEPDIAPAAAALVSECAFHRYMSHLDCRAAAAAGAVAGLPSPLAGFTPPAGITMAPAFSICLVTEAINSSQLLAKDSIPCSSRAFATSPMFNPARPNNSKMACAAA